MNYEVNGRFRVTSIDTCHVYVWERRRGWMAWIAVQIGYGAKADGGFRKISTSDLWDCTPNNKGWRLCVSAPSFVSTDSITCWCRYYCLCRWHSRTSAQPYVTRSAGTFQKSGTAQPREARCCVCAEINVDEGKGMEYSPSRPTGISGRKRRELPGGVRGGSPAAFRPVRFFATKSGCCWEHFSCSWTDDSGRNSGTALHIDSRTTPKSGTALAVFPNRIRLQCLQRLWDEWVSII